MRLLPCSGSAPFSGDNACCPAANAPAVPPKAHALHALLKGENSKPHSESRGFSVRAKLKVLTQIACDGSLAASTSENGSCSSGAGLRTAHERHVCRGRGSCAYTATSTHVHRRVQTRLRRATSERARRVVRCTYRHWRPWGSCPCPSPFRNRQLQSAETTPPHSEFHECKRASPCNCVSVHPAALTRSGEELLGLSRADGGGPAHFDGSENKTQRRPPVPRLSSPRLQAEKAQPAASPMPRMHFVNQETSSTCSEAQLLSDGDTFPREVLQTSGSPSRVCFHTQPH